MTATLYDFRDLDLMLKIANEGDEDGWVETEMMARSLGLREDDKRSVGIRLAWMRRYGMLEHDDKLKLWRLTPGGERVTRARLKASQARTIEALDDDAMVDVMSTVTTRYQLGSPLLANLLRREFMFGTQPGTRRNGKRRR